MIAQARHEPAAGELQTNGEGESFRRALRSVLRINSIRHLLVAAIVINILFASCWVSATRLLADPEGPGTLARWIVLAGIPAAAIAAALFTGRHMKRALQGSPEHTTDLGFPLMVTSTTTAALAATVPVHVVALMFLATAACLTSATSVVVTKGLWAVTAGVDRPHPAMLLMTAQTVGGLAGWRVLTSMEHLFGMVGTLAALLVPGLVAAARLKATRTTLEADANHIAARAAERAEYVLRIRSGQRPPLLECHGINFSYGKLQVLFDVDFQIDGGEMVALLGTNGAGKSTLLRVISGLGRPSTGGLRFGGTDLAPVEPDQRVCLGIAQVPGGRAIFGAMTVEENLRALAFTLRGDRKRQAAGIAASYEAFPRLGERRSQLAATLSGGEQQMLGLATAFILRPKLLLIDELSLGLAPVVVGQLLDMVRLINQQGTAIVLVEQSVNVALSLVDRAYFMEKGEIRFDGAACDLLARPDLLRSVFLDGASKGLASANYRPHLTSNRNGNA